MCLTTSLTAGLTWLEGPAAAGTMRINGQLESVVRSGRRFSLTVILRDEYGLPVSTSKWWDGGAGWAKARVHRGAFRQQLHS